MVTSLKHSVPTLLSLFNFVNCSTHSAVYFFDSLFLIVCHFFRRFSLNDALGLIVGEAEESVGSNARETEENAV